MEYNVLHNGDLVPSWQPRYLPESIPHNRQNMKVVLLPASYQGVQEAPYQSLRQDPYQTLQAVPYQNFQAPPRQSLPTPRHQSLQAQGLQAQNFLDVPYQAFQEVPYQGLPDPPRRSLQVASQQSQSLLETPYQNLQDLSHPTFQAPSLPGPVNQSIEDIFSTNGTATGSNEVLTSQNTRRSEENFDIDMATPLLEGAVEERDIDVVMPTLSETSSDSVCRSCGGHKNLKSFINELSSSQKKTTKALSLFASDVISDIDENKQWRISVEEKLERLLEGRAGDGASDFSMHGR